MELKQTTFGMPEQETKKQTKKKIRGMIASPSYWICINGHVFEQKQSIFEHQIQSIKCPICNSKIRNKSTKSTYEYFLKKEGRMDEKQYRSKKIAADKKRLDKHHD